MVESERLSRGGYWLLLVIVKYLPIVIHVMIVINIIDGLFFSYGITNWFYPLIGHSLVFDMLLLFFSYKFKFCKWHRILVYDMIINILLEWVSVNGILSTGANDTIILSMFVTVVCILSAMYDVFVCNGGGDSDGVS